MKFRHINGLAATLTLVASLMAVQASGQDAAPTHWIGVACAELQGALKAHLKIDSGLVVMSVVPDAPAAKAGIKVHDVIYAVNGKGISGLADLNRAVAKGKGKAIELAVVRGGKKTEVQVTPAARPAAADRRLIPVRPGQPVPIPSPPGQPKGLEGWWKAPGRFQIIRPGIILDGKKHKFPSDLSIAISKSGDGPAKISIRQGDKKWEVGEKELGKLPKEIRSHVQAMLGRQPFPGNFGIVQNGPPHTPRILIDPRSNPGKVPAIPGFPGDIQKQLQELERQMKEMRRVMEEFRRSQSDAPGLELPKPKKKASPKKTESKKDLF